MALFDLFFGGAPLRRIDVDPDSLVLHASHILSDAEKDRDRGEFGIAAAQAAVASGHIALATYLRTFRDADR